MFYQIISCRGGGGQVEDDLARAPPGRHLRHFGAQGTPPFSLFKGHPGSFLALKPTKGALKNAPKE